MNKSALIKPCIILLLTTEGLRAADPIPASQSPDISFRHEIQHAIDRGLVWFKEHQQPAGHWSTADQPAITALALMALQGDPAKRYQLGEQPFVERGYQVLLDAVQEDGGIHRGKLVTYNTALAMMAFIAANRPEYKPIIANARNVLLGLQVDFGEKGQLDTPFDGGVGYGSSYEHSDMGNTLQALEALYYSGQLLRDENLAGAKDLDWQAAIHFIQSCQNLPEFNKEHWASDDPQEKGGFVYYPGLSKAGQRTNQVTGRVALRSYASISYSGLLSYIYARLSKDDPRVLAVYDWLGNNYSLEENPGMGPQGLFYYYHTMAKALQAYDVQTLELADGRTVDWRKELAMKLINLQQPDGSWLNEEHGRWWEKDPALVTAYATLALEIIHGD